MNEIVHAHLPGITLVHLPTPPPQIRAITDHVYFYLDRTSPLWPEFSSGHGDRDAFRRRLAGAPDGALGRQGRPAMSDDDDPFGRRDRTIIRPNPAGRRPGAARASRLLAAAPPAGGAPPASTPTPPVSYPAPQQPAPAGNRQPPPYAPPGPPQPPPAVGQGELGSAG